MGRHVFARGVAAVVALLLVVACSAGETAQPDAGDTSALSIGLIAEPASLDFTTTDGAAIPEALLVNVYEGLVKIDQEGEIQPLLAESWEVSKDRKTYDFTLREGVTFSNGEPFTAKDVKFSIERVKSKAWTVSLKAGMDVVESVKVVSPRQVRVVLAEPSNSWLFRMTTRIGAMFSRKGVDDLANTPVGTGPYTLAEWVRGDRIVLEANPDYWGTKPALTKVTLRYFKDPTALNNALLSGGIDVIGTVQAPEALEQFTSDDRFEVIEGTTNGEVTLAFNNGSGPLRDLKVRQAIKHAIDRQALLETSWAGHGQLIGSMVPPHDPWYEDLTGLYPHDPEKAKQLLADAGAENLKLDLRIPNLPYAVSAAQVIKSQLEQVGISTNIDPLEFPARWLEAVFTNANYDMSIISHVEPRDIGTFGNPDYYWRYDSEEVQELLAEADRGGEAEQVDKMKAVARKIAEDAAADWLYLQPNLIVSVKGVQGLPSNRVGESFDLTTLSRG